MTKCYHICFTSHNEVMFRNNIDYIFGIFSMVLASIRTHTIILAFALMSDHVHVAIMTSSYTNFVIAFRRSYSLHFNKRYKREGALGELGYYHKELIGTNHIIAAISYILRNPIHHGICKSPFEYKYTSSNCYFNKFFCRKPLFSPCLMSRRKMSDLGMIHRNSVSDIPNNYRFDENGTLIFSDFVDVTFVENHYVSGRRFSYYMTRPSNEEWAKEQMKDMSGSQMAEEEYLAYNPPINLETIEPSFSLPDLQKKEGCNFQEKRILDNEVCELIDQCYLPRYDVESYVQLNLAQKEEIAKDILSRYYAGKKQLQRCLSITLKS